MKTIYLVRHGKRESYHEDTLLSQLGVKQAELTGKYLKSKKIEEIIASPLPRTQQTAKIISESLNLEVKTDERLKERIVWKEAMDESFEEFIEEWDKETQDRHYRSHGRDSSIMSGVRLESVVSEVSEGKTVLIVAHSGIIGDYLLNHFPSDILPFQRDPLNSVLSVEILECSVTELQIDSNKTTLLRVNDASHLPASLV